MMRLLPSHRAAVRRKELKTEASAVVFIHICAPATTPSWEGLFCVKEWKSSLTHWFTLEKTLTTIHREHVDSQKTLSASTVPFNSCFYSFTSFGSTVLFLGFFFYNFSFILKLKWFNKTGAFGNLQHHLRKKKHSEANEANWKQVTEPRLHVKRFNGPKARIGKGEALAWRGAWERISSLNSVRNREPTYIP